MSRHARIEEVSDSGSDSDPSDMDPTDFSPSPSTTTTSSTPFPSASSRPPPNLPPSTLKTWHCLYPLYFDASRSRADGRRVAKSLAVTNPLATEIADAARTAGLDVRLEVERTHPRDWANPGRARVDLKGKGGRGGGGVKNKHHLYILVARYLQSHPTTEQTPLRLPSIPGEERKAKPAPAVPRGWKMNTILPMHSPAVKGHGVSENLFKDMQEGMGIEGGSGGSAAVAKAADGKGKAKKDKKGKRS